MKRKRARLTIALCVLAAGGTVLSLPGLPWSARCHYVARRAMSRFGATVAAWRGVRPRPVSLSGTLAGSGALVESLKGAQVAAVESVSGYAAMSDGAGRFTLPHLLWFPGARYNLIVTADEFHSRSFELRAPAAYPEGGTIDAGELRFDEGAEVTRRDRLRRAVKYDRENRDYYRDLFARLAATAASDHQRIDAVCRYVATRHNPDEDPFRFKSARQIIESGAPHCSNLAFAMAAITAAGGYPSRTVHTSDTPEYPHTHVVTEVYYDEAWHLYDPTYGVFFRDPAGRVASYRELHLMPELVTALAFERVPPDVTAAALEWMPAGYRSGLNQIYEASEAAFVDEGSWIELALQGL